MTQGDNSYVQGGDCGWWTSYCEGTYNDDSMGKVQLPGGGDRRRRTGRDEADPGKEAGYPHFRYLYARDWRSDDDCRHEIGVRTYADNHSHRLPRFWLCPAGYPPGRNKIPAQALQNGWTGRSDPRHDRKPAATGNHGYRRRIRKRRKHWKDRKRWRHWRRRKYREHGKHRRKRPHRTKRRKCTGIPGNKRYCFKRRRPNRSRQWTVR